MWWKCGDSVLQVLHRRGVRGCMVLETGRTWQKHGMIKSWRKCSENTLKMRLQCSKILNERRDNFVKLRYLLKIPKSTAIQCRPDTFYTSPRDLWGCINNATGVTGQLHYVVLIRVHAYNTCQNHDVISIYSTRKRCTIRDEDKYNFFNETYVYMV